MSRHRVLSFGARNAVPRARIAAFVRPACGLRGGAPTTDDASGSGVVVPGEGGSRYPRSMTPRSACAPSPRSARSGRSMFFLSALRDLACTTHAPHGRAPVFPRESYVSKCVIGASGKCVRSCHAVRVAEKSATLLACMETGDARSRDHEGSVRAAPCFESCFPSTTL